MLCSTACAPGIWGERWSLVWSLESLSGAFRAIYLQNPTHTPSEPFCPDVPAHNQLDSSVWSLRLGCVHLRAIRLSNCPLLDPVTHHSALQPLSWRTRITHLLTCSLHQTEPCGSREKLSPSHLGPCSHEGWNLMSDTASGANSSKSRAQQGHWSVSSVFKDQLISVLPSWTHTKNSIVIWSPFKKKSGWFFTVYAPEWHSRGREMRSISTESGWEMIEQKSVQVPGQQLHRENLAVSSGTGRRWSRTPGSSERGELF